MGVLNVDERWRTDLHSFIKENDPSDKKKHQLYFSKLDRRHNGRNGGRGHSPRCLLVTAPPLLLFSPFIRFSFDSSSFFMFFQNNFAFYRFRRLIGGPRAPLAGRCVVDKTEIDLCFVVKKSAKRQ